MYKEVHSDPCDITCSKSCMLQALPNHQSSYFMQIYITNSSISFFKSMKTHILAAILWTSTSDVNLRMPRGRLFKTFRAKYVTLLVIEIPCAGGPTNAEIDSEAAERFVGQIDAVTIAAHTLINNFYNDTLRVMCNCDSFSTVWIVVRLRTHECVRECDNQLNIAVICITTCTEAGCVESQVSCTRAFG